MNNLLNKLQGWVQNGYAGNHLMAQSAEITDVAVATGGKGVAVAAATVQFQKANVFSQCITMRAAPAGNATVRFPVYTKLSSATIDPTMSANAEGADAALTDIETTAVDCTPIRYGTYAQVTDLSSAVNADALLANAGQVLGNQIARIFDEKVATLMDGFANGASNANDILRMEQIWQALSLLEANDAPKPFHCVLHPKQMWGPFGLSKELQTLTTATPTADVSAGSLAGPSNPLSNQFYNDAAITRLGPVTFYTSSAVTSDGDDGHEGGMFSSDAIGCGYIDQGGGSMIAVSTGRDEPAALTEVVANAYFEAKELVDVWGVEIITETS